jgi:hypothetical protein
MSGWKVAPGQDLNQSKKDLESLLKADSDMMMMRAPWLPTRHEEL